jgi:hypothetical protein
MTELDNCIIMLYSSSSSDTSTLAPLDPPYPELESPQEEVKEERSVRKKRKVQHSSLFNKPEEPELSYLEQEKRSRKLPEKKQPAFFHCAVCATKSSPVHSIRPDALWLYRIIFPNVSDLAIKGRICRDCHKTFKTSPCVHCGEPGGCYWLNEAKISDAREVFESQELPLGRLCGQCGDRLSKYVNKKKK